MSPLLLLTVYSAALVAAAVAGARIPRYFEMTHTRTQLAMSLVSGLMLGIAIFHLLPHGILTLGVERGMNAVMGWVALGLVTMLLLLRLFHFHQPDYHNTADEDHVHDQDHNCEHEHAVAEVKVNWRAVLLGLSVHTLVDGVALGAALLGAPHGDSGEWLGFGVFLAIVLHKPLDAMSISALMRAGGAGKTMRRTANTIFALLCPLGALLFYLGAGASANGALLVGAALAFTAGAFICIALSDLLPEVQFHSHDRGKLTAVFLVGILLSFLLANTSPQHSHDVSRALNAAGDEAR